jgi:SAM-dependent methyltransferase
MDDSGADFLPPYDVSVAYPARIYDYWLGGKDNFEADRAVGDKIIELRPEIVYGVQLNRRFLGRAVRYLAMAAGIRQFLDIGTGLPSANGTHEVAQRAAPSARIVYVDNDPIVLTHARALLTSAPEGKTAYVSADLRDTQTVLAEAAKTLNFARPVALMFLMTLQYIPDAEEPQKIVRRYLDAMAPGSFLAISDPVIDGDEEVLAESARRMNEGMGGKTTQTRRTPQAMTRFFDGLELLAPGLVPLDQWRPDPHDLTGGPRIPARAAVARKPCRPQAVSPASRVARKPQHD